VAHLLPVLLLIPVSVLVICKESYQFSILKSKKFFGKSKHIIKLSILSMEPDHKGMAMDHARL
jgi:hypothetical protein